MAMSRPILFRYLKQSAIVFPENRSSREHRHRKSDRRQHEKKTRDTRRPGEERHQPSEPARDWVARCRQCAESGWLAGDVPGPRQGKRRPVESGSRLALGPGLKAVV